MSYWASKEEPHLSDRMSSGFVGGGGNWYVEVLHPDNISEYWMARWEVWNENAPEQRIWRVTYGMLSKGKTSEEKMPPLEDVIKNLEKSLEEICHYQTWSFRGNIKAF